MLSDDGTFATCLQIICLAAYGEEIYQVDPLELLLRLEEDFNVRVTQANENKLKAILLATETDIFYDVPEAFRGTCETLTNGDPGLEIMDDLTVPEVLWGVYEVELNHGPNPMSPPVQALLDRTIADEGDDSEVSGSDDPFNHVWAYLNDRRMDLGEQLSDLGIDPSQLPPIQPQDQVRTDPAMEPVPAL